MNLESFTSLPSFTSGAMLRYASMSRPSSSFRLTWLIRERDFLGYALRNYRGFHNAGDRAVLELHFPVGTGLLRQQRLLLSVHVLFKKCQSVVVQYLDR